MLDVLTSCLALGQGLAGMIHKGQKFQGIDRNIGVGNAMLLLMAGCTL